MGYLGMCAFLAAGAAAAGETVIVAAMRGRLRPRVDACPCGS